MKRNSILLVLILLAVPISLPGRAARAQGTDGTWSGFVNLSNSPVASTYPCITADKAGNVHVIWSEDVGGKTSNPVLNSDGSLKLDANGEPMNVLQDLGNTLFYTRWDGEQWLTPIDIAANSSGYLEYPRAAVDSKGILHTVFIETQAENVHIAYSRVPSELADQIPAWSDPIVIAERSASIYYPVDLAIDSKDGLHVLYAQLGANPGAYVINSTDGGNNWSDPIQLYAAQDPNGTNDGVSTMRLLVDNQDRLHASWTHFDRSGNGKAVYYAQSDDLGNTWSRPFEAATWQPTWYETDWVSIGVVGNELHLTWEGGKQSYLNELISTDGGQTWGASHRILTNLVGENGFAEMATDSNNHLYMLVVKRGQRADNASGVWYTSWDADHWVDPILVGTNNFIFYNKMTILTPAEIDNILRGTLAGSAPNYPVATIVNGNQLFLVIVREVGGDIWSSHTTLDAPLISPTHYPQPTQQPTATPLSQAQAAVSTPTPLPASMTAGSAVEDSYQPSFLLLVGVLPVVLILVGFIVYIRVHKHF